jgi:hypothetical protein
MKNVQIYNATKTANRFHVDDSRVRLQVGPVGCGKSVSDCIEVFRRGCEQEPGNDGIRRSRWAIIRNTYPELKKTTIKTWQDWFPEQYFGPVKWDSPPTHRIQIDDLDIEVIFLALDSENAVGKLMSFELTGVYINEMQFIHKKVFDICNQRIDRYPAKKSGAKITWAGIIADTNPPSTRHWIYNLFEKNKPDDYSVYHYEPALIKVNNAPSDVKYAISLDGTIYINNPDADYIENVPNQYYWLNQVSGCTDEQIKVYLLGQYGIIIDGRPVHSEYNDKIHYSHSNLRYNPDVEIGLGWDFGLTPACAIVQFTPTGQLVVLAELYSEHLGLRDFAENVVLPYLNKNYRFWKEGYVSRHDPAGQTGAQTDMKNCQEILRELGIRSLPAAPSNAPTPRRDGLKYHLRRLVDGQPGFLVSKDCHQIREGLMGQYQYAKIKANDGLDRYHDKPLKNEFSHICEALEYIAMHYAREVKKPVEQTNKSDDIAMHHYNLMNVRSARNGSYRR